MKLGISLTAMHKWLFLGIAFCACIGVSPRIHAEEIINEGDYVTFSTLLNGKRYYLGVDTVSAKGAPSKDTVMAYEQPNYATMWQMGEDHTVGEIHMRTVKNVWLAERVVREKYLSLGTDKGNYSGLVLSDAEHATMWQLGTSDSESERYIEGYVYYFSGATGVDVYRYIKYDPLYGFGRAYSSRPQSPIRMSIWDRKTGDDLRFDFRPETHTFGLETEEDTTILPLTAKVTFYENVDRFRSRDGRIDVFARVPTVIDNQETLIDYPYNLFMYYEWASNPRTGDTILPFPPTEADFKDDKYNGNSLMKYWDPYAILNDEEHPELPASWSGAWKDTALIHIRNFKFERKEENTIWHDTMYTVGTSPFDRPGARFLRPKGEPGSDPGEGLYVDHVDSLRVYFHCKGQMYRDAALVVRQTYHEQPFTTLRLSSAPNDYVFEPSVGSHDFTISARYTSGNTILSANGSVVQTMILEDDELDITSMDENISVTVLNADGTTPCSWLTATIGEGANKNKITANVTENSTEANRVAQIRYSYHFVHSSADGDEATAERILWITQKGKADGNAEIYVFSHKGDGDDTDVLQDVHEKTYIYYAIPGQELSLPVHYDLWGYYRWFNYENDKDLVYDGAWTWKNEPVNHIADESRNGFMPINPTTDVTSHGRWDFARNFTVGTPTPIPSISYPESASKTGKIACDVSAYTDIDTTGTIGVSLSAMTEPTLSYRQIFDIRPAKEQADKMATCLSGSEGWMEDKTVILPAKRAVTLEQQYPVSDKATSDVEDHLQYIYYHNTTNSSSMGTDPGNNYDKAASYARIGKSRTDGDEHLELLNFNGLADGTYTVLMVNPRQTGGYALGYASSSSFNYGEWTGTMSNAEAMKTWLQNNVMKQNAYRLTLKKSGSNIEVSRSGSGSITVSREGLFSDRWEMQWQSLHLWANAKTIKLYNYTITNNEGVPNDLTNMVALQMNYTAIFGIRTLSVEGYLHSKKSDGSQNDFHIVDGNAQEGEAANRAWVFYKIVSGGTTYNEIPRWYKKASGDADWVCIANGDSTASGYTMLDNGYLEISENVHKNPNETIQYCLKTQHFQLAKFTVVTRDADKEGPSERAIIPVETMLNEYEILFTLTSDNQIFPWDQSEMSFHYPYDPESAIGDRRVFVGDEPAKGEYAFMRSFRGIDAISGIGTTDYLLCLNAAEKPVQFMNFEFPQMSCSDQQLFFTAELCNPIRNAYNPQITAEMEGYNGSTWTPIYRYVTGELPYDDGKWYQLVMPIDQGSIAGYQKFRFKGYLSGSTESEAYVLMDHARFIAKERPLRIYQNNSTCLESDGKGGHQIDIIARLDYKNGTSPVGTLVAYQYQKWNSSTSSFDALTDRTYSYDESIEGTPNYGLVRVPRRDYVPSDSIYSLSDLPKNMKFYVNEGTAEDPYYTLYFTQTVPAESQDLFRIALAVIPTKETTPNFTTAGCATERLISVKNPVAHQIDGKPWESVTREAATTADTLKSPNETYRLSLKLNNVPDGAKEVHCKFDMLRSFEADRDYAAKVLDYRGASEGEKEAKKAIVDAADAAFLTKYGISRERLMDMLETFRADDERNPLRLVTNWNDVRPEDFMWSGRTKEEADLIYETLNKLIVTDRVLQIGLDYYDVFLGGEDDAYFYTRALPASGWYTTTANPTDTIHLPACNIPQWFEIHSKASDYVLRFGYDNIIDRSYQVPVIRASKSDANNHLKVRIAAITHNATSGVVIGWDSTYIVGSNDPTWNSSKHFRYHQDRIVQDDIFANYYHVPTEGSDAEIENDPHRYVIFRPVKDQSYIDSLSNATCDCYNYLTTAETKETMFSDKQADGCNFWHLKNTAGYQTKNDFTLKAGYWYKFKTAFFEANGTIAYNSAGDGECKGHAEFIVAVAPDTVVWAPSHPDEANFWNDDDNWRAVDGTGKVLGGSIATIPMGDSKVIIPSPSSENLLPILRGDENTIGRRVDLTDYGFTANTCRDILFKPNATIWGQENLNYTKAYVDVPFRQGNWQTFSPALEGIYSGDIYIPQNAGSGEDPDFAPTKFEDGTSWSNEHNRTYPYAFYQGYYNSSVSVVFQNTDEEGDPLETYTKTSTNSADWVRTNVLDQPLTPGKASIILGFGPRDEAEDSVLIVRLPKQETEYHYVGKKNGVYTGGSSTGTLTRAETQNLSYDKTKLGSSEGITYALTNAISNDIFFFGNPTMSLIDVYQLCEDNSGKLAGGDSHSYTIYQLQDGSAYTAQTVTGKGQHFVAPQRAVGLKALSANTSLDILLKPDALVPMTGVEDAPPPSPAPQRGLHRTTEEEHRSARLYISAANESDGGLCKSFITIGEQSGASRGYQVGEDALNLSSGLNYYNAASFATPLSMYTIADNQALMIDVRDSISMVPVVFKTLDAHYSYDEVTILSFATEGQWSQPLYLYDAVTNDSVMILNGMQIGIQTPLSDQIRYYIGYPHSVVSHQPSEEGTVTGIENEPTLNSSSEGRTCIYDLLGRKIMSLGEYDLISTISLPTGVYIIQRGNQTERMVVK